MCTKIQFFRKPYYILGKNEGKGTALTATTAVELLEEKDVSPGIYHIDQIFNIDEFIDRFGKNLILNKMDQRE